MDSLPEKVTSFLTQCRMNNGVCWGILLEKDTVDKLQKNYTSIDNFIRNIETGNQELTEMRWLDEEEEICNFFVANSSIIIFLWFSVL